MRTKIAIITGEESIITDILAEGVEAKRRLLGLNESYDSMRLKHFKEEIKSLNDCRVIIIFDTITTVTWSFMYQIEELLANSTVDVYYGVLGSNLVNGKENIANLYTKLVYKDGENKVFNELRGEILGKVNAGYRWMHHREITYIIRITRMLGSTRVDGWKNRFSRVTFKLNECNGRSFYVYSAYTDGYTHRNDKYFNDIMDGLYKIKCCILDTMDGEMVKVLSADENIDTEKIKKIFMRDNRTGIHVEEI